MLFGPILLILGIGLLGVTIVRLLQADGAAIGTILVHVFGPLALIFLSGILKKFNFIGVEFMTTLVCGAFLWQATSIFFLVKKMTRRGANG